MVICETNGGTPNGRSPHFGGADFRNQWQRVIATWTMEAGWERPVFTPACGDGQWQFQAKVERLRADLFQDTNVVGDLNKTTVVKLLRFLAGTCTGIAGRFLKGTLLEHSSHKLELKS